MFISTFFQYAVLSLPGWIILGIIQGIIAQKTVKEKRNKYRVMRIGISAVLAIPLTILAIFAYACIAKLDGDSLGWMFVIYIVQFIPLTLVFTGILYVIEKRVE